jgi:hypothetical protein
MTKPTTPTDAEIITANVAALRGRLRHASVLALDACTAMTEARQNLAIDTIAELERILPECDALYRTIMLLHRSRDSFEQNEVHS